jgi:hypothetical protein
MDVDNESGNKRNASGKTVQAAGRQGRSSGSHSARGAATDKAAQRRGGRHSHGGR